MLNHHYGETILFSFGCKLHHFFLTSGVTLKYVSKE